MHVGLNSPDNVAYRGAAIRLGLQVDKDAAAVKRGVRPIDANEGGKADNIGISTNDIRQRSLTFTYSGKRHFRTGARDGLNKARVLHGEKALWDRHIKDDRQSQSRGRNDKRQRLVIEHPIKALSVVMDHA